MRQISAPVRPGLSHLLCPAVAEGRKSDRQQSSGSLHQPEESAESNEIARADARSLSVSSASPKHEPETVYHVWGDGCPAWPRGSWASASPYTQHQMETESTPRFHCERKTLSLRVLEF